MIVTTLVENSSLSKEYKKKHGLCLHIKTENHNTLFDLGTDDNLYLVSNISSKTLIPSSNKLLFKKENNKYIEDNFNHEQNLIIRKNNKYVLISGCSHCGITNIIDTIEEVINEKISTVIGGFHLYNPVNKKIEEENFIKNLGENLSYRNINFYTCHCTGYKPFNILKSILKDKINSISTGEIINV